MENHKSIEHQLRIYEIESEEAARDRDFSGGDILKRRMTQFFSSQEAARRGLRTQIILAAEHGGTGFITVKVENGGDPDVYAGIVDVMRVNDYGLTYINDLNHLGLPTEETCSFRYRRPLEVEEKAIPIKIIRGREGFRPRIFLGSPDDLKDMITRPAYSSNTSFRSFLAGLHPNSLKPEDEQIMRISNQIFNYFDFIGEDRLNDR